MIGYTYDALNRLKTKDLPGTTTGDVYYGYDAAGRVSFAHYGSVGGTGVDYTYDTAKRLHTEVTPGRTLTYDYDLAGNRIKLTFPDANFFNYDFDGLNRNWRIRENGATSGAGVLVTYNYDPLSRPHDVARGNGVATTFGFDLASRLTSLSHEFADPAKKQVLTLGYTGASQLQSRLDSNNTYEQVALAASQAYTPNGLNQYTAVSGVAYGYDQRGNLTSDGTRLFAYDAENHLLSVTGGAGITLSYDPLGRLSQSISGSTTTDFVYDGDRLVAEYAGTSVLRRYIHGPGTDVPVVWYEGAALTTKNWLHADERGSIVATSDGGGTGTVYTYGPYGEPDT